MKLPPFALALAALVSAAACSSSTTIIVVQPDAGKTTKDAAKDATSTHPTDDATADAADDAEDAAVTPEASTSIPDAHAADAIIDPKDCVSTTATSSENGVGGYCSPGAGQCLHMGTGGTTPLCTADFGAPAHEWFCTVACTTNSDCGAAGGTCLAAPFGQICVPTACAGALGDAQSAVVVDAGSDAGHDAGAPVDAAHTADADAAAHDAASHG